jgi:protein XagA
MKRIYFPFLLIAIFVTDLSAQSGWTRSKGGIYAKTGVSTLSSDKYYDTEGNLNTGARKFYQQMVSFYGEYGVTKNITAILNYPFLKFQHYKDFETVKGIANPQLELRFALLKKIPVISLAVGGEIPIAKQNNFSIAKFESAPGIRESINLPAGYADFNYWGTLAISSGFGNVPGWATISTQYILRGKNYSNQAKLGFEIGYKWTPKFWTNARLTGFYQANKKASTTGNITNGEGTEYTTIAVGAAYEFKKHWSITADFQAYNDVLVRLKNVYAAPFYQIGFSTEF